MVTSVTFDEIESKVKTNNYVSNIEKLNDIISNKSIIASLDKFAQLELFYYAVIVSKKYKKNYLEVVDLFDEFTNLKNLFDVAYRKFYFFNTLQERIDYINCLKSNDIYLSYRLLKKIISETKIKNIIFFKRMYCEICVDMIDLPQYNDYQKIDFAQNGLKVSKELNEKEIYATLIKKDEEIKQKIISTMGETTFEFPNEVNKSLNQISQKIRHTFSKVPTVEDFIKLFVNRFYIQVEGMAFIHSLSESMKSSKEIVKREKSIADFVSWNTYDGMKLVKSRKIDGMVDDFARKIMIKIVINPMLEEGVIKLGKEEIVDYLCDSYFLFEEDKEDIRFALNSYFNGDYKTFIYYVIPNIEKILRNILEINGIPSYENSSTNPQYQTTFVLTDSLKKIEEEKIFNSELVRLLTEKLNDSEFENYRNRLSHKLDNNIFCYDCASDLMRILIVILFCYEKEDDFTNIFGEKKEIEEIVKNLEEKRLKKLEEENKTS